MKSREEAVKLIKAQFEGCPKPDVVAEVHYGLIELRQLMDFIYEGEPATEEELIPKDIKDINI